MFHHLTLISAAFTAIAIKWDESTQFTHPTLHALALAGMAAVAYSMLAAA